MNATIELNAPSYTNAILSTEGIVNQLSLNPVRRERTYAWTHQNYTYGGCNEHD